MRLILFLFFFTSFSSFAQMNSIISEKEYALTPNSFSDNFYYSSEFKKSWRIIRTGQEFRIHRLDNSFEVEDSITLKLQAESIYKKSFIDTKKGLFFFCFGKNGSYNLNRYDLFGHRHNRVDLKLGEGEYLSKSYCWGDRTALVRVSSKNKLSYFILVDFIEGTSLEVKNISSVEDYFELQKERWVLTKSVIKKMFFGYPLYFQYKLKRISEKGFVDEELEIDSRKHRFYDFNTLVRGDSIFFLGLTVFEETANRSRWGVTNFVFSKGKLKQSHITVTDIDCIFERFSNTKKAKERSLKRRDKLNEKGKCYNISPYVVSLSNMLVQDGKIYLALDFSEPKEELVEESREGDREVWKVVEHRHKFALLLTFKEGEELIDSRLFSMEVGSYEGLLDALLFNEQLSRSPVSRHNSARVYVVKGNKEPYAICRYGSYITLQAFTEGSLQEYYSVDMGVQQRKEVKRVSWRTVYFDENKRIVLESRLKKKKSKLSYNNLRFFELRTQREAD